MAKIREKIRIRITSFFEKCRGLVLVNSPQKWLNFLFVPKDTQYYETYVIIIFRSFWNFTFNKMYILSFRNANQWYPITSYQVMGIIGLNPLLWRFNPKALGEECGWPSPPHIRRFNGAEYFWDFWEPFLPNFFWSDFDEIILHNLQMIRRKKYLFPKMSCRIFFLHFVFSEFFFTFF